MSKLSIPIGIPASSCRRTKIVTLSHPDAPNRTGQPARPHLHVVVQYFQEAVVLIVVERGGEGGASQERGAGVIGVELLHDRRRRGELRDRDQASAPEPPATLDPTCTHHEGGGRAGPTGKGFFGLSAVEGAHTGARGRLGWFLKFKALLKKEIRQ